jgi:hypothetical protein
MGIGESGESTACNLEVSMNKRTTRALVLASLSLASAIALVPSAQAQNKFDGTWSVVVVTNTGPCEPSYRGQVQVVNSLVYAAGSGQGNFSGRVSPSGAVTVTLSVGSIYGVATGKLLVSSGSGSFRAQLNNERCAGSWNARRE